MDFDIQRDELLSLQSVLVVGAFLMAISTGPADHSDSPPYGGVYDRRTRNVETFLWVDFLISI
jgi:hypothetical protein